MPGKAVQGGGSVLTRCILLMPHDDAWAFGYFGDEASISVALFTLL
jgi:hypothetical protein